MFKLWEALVPALRSARLSRRSLSPPLPRRVRNQNSLVLLRRARFDAASALDVTHEVTAILGSRCMLAPGDLVVATVNCHAGCGSAGRPFLQCSL